MKGLTVPWVKSRRKRSDPADAVFAWSGIRLARNLDGEAFPGNSTPDRRRAVCAAVREALAGNAVQWTYRNAESLDASEAGLLEDARLLPADFLQNPQGRAILASPRYETVILVNGDDHLRIGADLPGLALNRIYPPLDALDDELSSRLSYAFSPSLGFMTSDPAAAGCALRAGVFLHLPGIMLSCGEEKILLRTAEPLGVALSGFFGAKDEFPGNLYELSNRGGLGESESEILERVTAAARRIADEELTVREDLKRRHPERIQDFGLRSFALLKNAYLMSAAEAMNCFSGVRLALETGYLDPLPAEINWNELLLGVQAHGLALPSGEKISTEEQAYARASFLRGIFNPGERP